MNVKNSTVLMLFLIGTCIFFNASAQPGAIDLTFNPTDIGFGSGEGANSDVNSIAIQSDGKILIGGQFTSYNGTSRNRIARLNSDGSLDMDFDLGAGASDIVYSIAIQSDGKILIGGSFTSYNGTSRNRIARLNSEGSLDTGFDPGSGANNTIESIVIQSDGKILIGGYFTSYNGTSRNGIARLNSDGSLETGFDPGTGASTNSYINSVALQSDGKILIGGSFTSYNGTSRNRIARLNSDGNLDTSFDPGMGANNTVNSIALQIDEKILIGGWFDSYNGTGRNYIARLNSDGSLDTAFDPGSGVYNYPYTIVLSIAVQSDGKVLIGGWFTSYNGTQRNYIARLNSDGSLDIGFDPGTVTNRLVYSIAIQSDGKILIGGQFTSYNGTTRNHIARLNSDGSLDMVFDPGTGANDIVYSIAIQSDGKILIGGSFTSYNGTGRNRITRLNSDGSLDKGFDPGSGADNAIESIVIQSDGKILIGGHFTSYNGTSRQRIARLNSDGSLDTGFNSGTGVSGTSNPVFVYSITVQSDGKILIGGFFTSYKGASRNNIARLNSDGSLDTGFNPGTGTWGSVNSMAVQSDGKILIGGPFTSYNGTSRSGIARLNSNGSLDTGFDPGTGVAGVSYPVVYSINVQSNAKILIAGDFTFYNGTSRSRIARLNSDGSLDTGFDPGTGVVGASYPGVYSVNLQSDGKILIGGFFTSYNGTARNSIARLNMDGSMDTSFDPGTGANNSVFSITIQSDGKILIGGNFTSYNGTGRNRIARIMGDNLSTSISSPVSLNSVSSAFPNPFNNYTIIKAGNGALLNNAVINLYDVNGNQVMNMANLKPDEIRIDRGRLVSGMYFYQVFSNNELIGSGKLIVQE
jgi:uncharacterized delta-60 repeat protein